MNYLDSVNEILDLVAQHSSAGPTRLEQAGSAGSNLSKAYAPVGSVSTASTIAHGVLGMAALPFTAALAPWFAAFNVYSWGELQNRIEAARKEIHVCTCNECDVVTSYIGMKIEDKSRREAAKATYIGQPFEAIYTYGKKLYRAARPSTQRKILFAKLLQGDEQRPCTQAIGIMVALAGGPEARRYLMTIGRTSEQVIAGAILDRTNGAYVIKNLMP
ncbi:MAG: hypothetical protein CMM01_24070 [Rhodopirellula sp.]|nr:hypothetical protein [Rhodopirellula sp.]